MLLPTPPASQSIMRFIVLPGACLLSAGPACVFGVLVWLLSGSGPWVCTWHTWCGRTDRMGVGGYGSFCTRRGDVCALPLWPQGRSVLVLKLGHESLLSLLGMEPRPLSIMPSALPTGLHYHIEEISWGTKATPRTTVPGMPFCEISSVPSVT